MSVPAESSGDDTAVATVLLKTGKRELQKCTSNRSSRCVTCALQLLLPVRPRLVTKPLEIGSATVAITIGIVCVSRTKVRAPISVRRSRSAVHSRPRSDRSLARHARASSRRDQTSGRADNPSPPCQGYAAPETKTAVERAHLLIEQAEALGEPPEDPLLLFMVLYGFSILLCGYYETANTLYDELIALADKKVRCSGSGRNGGASSASCPIQALTVSPLSQFSYRPYGG